jgi:hypothetical protein
MKHRTQHELAGKSRRALILRELKLMKRYLNTLDGLDREQYALDVMYAEGATQTKPLGSDQFRLFCEIADRGGVIEARDVTATHTRWLEKAGRDWIEKTRRHDGVTVWCLSDLAEWYLERSSEALRRAHDAFREPEKEVVPSVVGIRPRPVYGFWGANEWEVVLSNGQVDRASTHFEANHCALRRRYDREDYEARCRWREREAQNAELLHAHEEELREFAARLSE